MSIIPLPLSAYDISETNAQSILEIYDNLKSIYSPEFDTDFTFNFKEYQAFAHNEINDFGPVIRFSNNNRPFYLAFIEVSYTTSGSRRGDRTTIEFQTWGVVSLRSNFGHILIKPETFLDRIHNFICPVELNFEDDKAFSKKFYVLTNDGVKTDLQINQAFRNCIQKIHSKDFIVEIINNNLIIGNEKIIEQPSALDFVAFLSEISKFF